MRATRVGPSTKIYARRRVSQNNIIIYAADTLKKPQKHYFLVAIRSELYVAFAVDDAKR